MRNLNGKIPVILLAIFIIYILVILVCLSYVSEDTNKNKTTIISHVVGEKPFEIKTDKNLIITVKTSSLYYSTRLKYILETWYRLAPHQIFFISDKADPDLPIDLGKHFLYTDCGSSHQRVPLSCKLTAELEIFFKAKADWSCHFDDDNYVNVLNLAKFLSDKNSNLPRYFGKISVAKSIKVVYKNESISFAFGTGGAGFCLSRSLVEKLFQLVTRNITVLNISNELGLTDDVALGFIITYFLEVPLTEISLSALNKERTINTVDISPIAIDEDIDNFRFRAIHCFLFPKMCDFLSDVV